MTEKVRDMKYKVSLLVKIEEFRNFEAILNNNGIEIENEEIIQGNDSFDFTKVTISTPMDSKLIDKLAKFDNYPLTIVKVMNEKSIEIKQIIWG